MPSSRLDALGSLAEDAEVIAGQVPRALCLAPAERLAELERLAVALDTVAEAVAVHTAAGVRLQS